MATYVTKYNERLPGAEAPYTDAAYEVGAVEPGFVYLQEVPLPGSVEVTDFTGTTTFTEVTDPAAVLGPTEYRVAYEGTVGAGRVEFSGALDGDLVLISSLGTGSGLYAHDLNALAEGKADLDGSRKYTGALLPATSVTHSIGSASFRWNNVYSGGGDFAGNVTVGGSITQSNGIMGNGGFRLTGSVFSRPIGGVGLEGFVTAGDSYLTSYNSSTSTYATLRLVGSPIRFMLDQNTTEAGRFTPAGNFLVGNTALPGWDTRWRALQVGTAIPGVLWASTSGVNFGWNHYHDGTTYRYIGADTATQLFTRGTFQFSYAPLGAPGDPITWKDGLYITGDGNVIIGSTANAGFKLDVYGYGRYAQAVPGGAHYVLIHNNAVSAAGNKARLSLAPHSGFAASIAPYVEAYDDGAGDTGLALGTYRGGSGLSERVKVNGLGQLLVGTSSETLSNLTVARFSGTTPEIRVTDETSYYASISFWAKGGGATPTSVGVVSSYHGQSMIYGSTWGHWWRVGGSGNYIMKLFTSGNLVLSNTDAVDAGYKFDVLGTARVSDVVTFGSRTTWSTATLGAPGSIYRQAVDGLAIWATTGSSYDFAIAAVSGSYVARVPTGTNGLTIVGNVGFYGATPAAKPTGVAVTAAGIHAALISLGLIAA